MTKTAKKKFDAAFEEMDKRFRISHFAMVCYENGVREKDLKSLEIEQFLDGKAIRASDGYWEKIE